MIRSSLAAVAIAIGLAGVAFAAQHKIGQKGRLFSPGNITVKAGDEIVFQNDDDVTHDIYSSTKDQEFTLATMPPGSKVAHTFDKKGRIDVRCGLHPGMRLVVNVE
jgi:plastocyanin